MENTEITERVNALATKYGDLPEPRLATLAKAFELGADENAITEICEAARMSRASTIVLPKLHYETLSRGKGWCRKGRGKDVIWAERVPGGYEVGPGSWTLGADDGFSRKKTETWDVKNIIVGTETWTVAR